jgi:hypothetical protein
MKRLGLIVLLLVSCAMLPKPSLAEHQGGLDASCTTCHDVNLFRQHGGFAAAVCLRCHDSQQPAVRETIARGKLGQVAHCLDCHGQVDHSFTHDRTFLPAPECAACHQADVAVEHANRGLNCAACHENPEPQVQNAIALGQAGTPIDCAFCHWVTDHAAVHEREGEVALPPYGSLTYCGDCHSNNVATELLNRGFTCQTCHESADPVVQAAIAAGTSGPLATCDACHSWEEIDEVHHDQPMGCMECHYIHGGH